jgi:peptide/nickel transport system ATP-binding protein
MIFQDPYASLNPRWLVEDIIAEPLREHGLISDKAALKERVGQLLTSVGLAAADMAKYPHQFSGGQRQRITIAMALACGPDLLIADEPTTALDVTVQRQILELLAGLVAERGMALILISHDLGVIAQSVARTLVMYGGTVVESGPTRAVFGAMAHPYTQGLFAARPRLGTARVAGERLPTIAGSVPDLADLPAGCPFAGRCPRTLDACHAALPPAVALGAGHEARCIRLGEP